MKCSLGISNFLEKKNPSLSHSIVFLYFFAQITYEGFLVSPCYSLELCIQMGILFLFLKASPSHQDTSTRLLSSSISGQKEWKTQSQKTNRNDHMTTALSNSLKLKPYLVGPPRQTDHGEEFWQNMVHWKMEWQTTSAFLPWELHEQYEKSKRLTLTDELSRSVGVQYATGEEWKNTAERRRGWAKAETTSSYVCVWWWK